MTATTHTHTIDAQGWIASLFADIKRRRAEHEMYRRTLNELRALSDRELSDLGLSRADIHAVAREAACGDA